MSKKKKVFVLCIMFVLLAATAVLNFTLASGSQKPDGDGALVTGNFYSQSRTERVASRNQELAYLDSLIAMEGAEYEATRTDAAAQKLKIVQMMELEVTLENLLKASGFEDCLVTIGALSDNVNVIVKKAEVTSEDAAKIYTVVKEEAQISPNNVRIIPVA